MEWGFDHLVIRCRDVEAALRFYVGVLGLLPEREAEWRAGRAPFPSVRIAGDSVIDLLPAGEGAAPSGAADGEERLGHFCLAVDGAGFGEVRARLAAAGIPVEEGPVERWGARGAGISFYVRDPDGVRIEIKTYDRRAGRRE